MLESLLDIFQSKDYILDIANISVFFFILHHQIYTVRFFFKSLVVNYFPNYGQKADKECLYHSSYWQEKLDFLCVF